METIYTQNMYTKVKKTAEIDLVKYYRVWCEIIPSQNNYNKLYICTTKNIEKLTPHRKYVGLTYMYVTQIKYF